MSDELKELATLALCNAFWCDFSKLVNRYLELGKGLNIDQLEMQMGDMTSIYGRDTKLKGDILIYTHTIDGDEGWVTTEHKNILKSLRHKKATEVYLCGKKVFCRLDKNSPWVFLDE